jgi:hypothetical protein
VVQALGQRALLETQEQRSHPKRRERSQ